MNAIKGNCTSKFKGVCWHKAANKWYASIQKDKRIYYLGVFEIEIDAAKAYNERAKELFKEFANLNEVD